MQLKSFIEKPVLSSVISIIIVVAGVVSLASLPIEQYPSIAPPTVSVSTSYYGASAQTIQNAVLAPLEDAINGVDNMTYMVSTSDNSGNAEITIYFEQGTNPDMNAVNVQNRVSKATSLLPAEVKTYGVTTEKQMNSILQIFAIYSPDDRYDSKFLCNYLNINVKPKIMRIHGVGKFSMFGAEYSMRIWLKPEVLLGHNLTPSDILNALAEQNIESATGSFGENSSEQYQYTMVYSGRLKSVEEFERIIVRVNEDGEVLYLKDIADIELGSEYYKFDSKVNGHPGAVCLCYQLSGSNATEVNNNISALIESIKPDLPEGCKIEVLQSSNTFLYASMHEVIKTLIEAILLVIIIVWLFLHDLRSTIIPFVGIMVSLIGTFAFMLVAGFSINLITLFALVLVIGTVVDDSIVVVEAVHEKLDAGYTSSLKAAIDAMGEITTAVITSSLVFMAVFIPVSFMGGTSGTFFRQFGLTMAVAVGISAINALTLSPALCALLIKPKAGNKDKKSRLGELNARFAKAFDEAFVKMSEKYQNGIRPLIKHPWISFVMFAGMVVLMLWVMKTTPTGFVPQEDTCQLMCDVILPPGTSNKSTAEYMAEIYKDIATIEDIRITGQINGFGFTAGNLSNAACFIMNLKDWDEREFMSVMKVAQRIGELNAKYKDVTIIPFLMPMIPGYGTSSDAEINLQNKTGVPMNEFFAISEQFIEELNKRPEVGTAYTPFSMSDPQYLVQVDVAKCRKAGLSSKEVLDALAVYYGSAYVNDINLYGRVYKVMVQAKPDARRTENSLSSMFVRTPSGKMAPLSSFITLTRMFGVAYLNRFNMLTSIKVIASQAEGYSSGDVIKAVDETAKEVLTKDYAYEYGGMTREQSGGSSMGIIFGISALLIYLILAALYESYLLPFSIMLTVPAGIAFAFLFTKIFGLDNNIYLQVGVVMLIGLLSKTGILITEFAVQLRKSGQSIVDSALNAAKLRLRPILMTAGTMVVGLLPLVTSSGAGAIGNISLGTGTVFGMLFGCIGLLFLVPALYVVFEGLQEKIKPLEKGEMRNEK